ncbi:MAG: hypothetical protein GY711_32365 [bacterium]|nr:hypothetical protein [bacterium]
MHFRQLAITTTLSVLPLAAPLVGADGNGVTITEDDCSGTLQVLGAGIFDVDTTSATTGVEGQMEPACLVFIDGSVTSDVWFVCEASSRSAHSSGEGCRCRELGVPPV